MCSENECGGLDRRRFLTSTAATFIGIASAVSSSAASQKPAPPTRILNDPGLQHSKMVFRSGREEIAGYLARPAGAGTYPGVLVIAGNWIHEEYILNTCAALAKAEFIGLAPNIYHPIPPDVRPDAAFDEIKRAFAGRTLDHLQIIQAGAAHLESLDFVRADRVGVLGFCFGGRLAMLVAPRLDHVRAVVAFHPAPMKAEEIAILKAPVQIHHGTADESVPHANSLDTERMLRRQGTPVDVFLYDGCNHGFLAYTRPFYDPDRAKLAWARTVTFLRRHLAQ
jgi:carboxymethylenebutenolidase